MAGQGGAGAGGQKEGMALQTHLHASSGDDALCGKSGDDALVLAEAFFNISGSSHLLGIRQVLASF